MNWLGILKKNSWLKRLILLSFLLCLVLTLLYYFSTDYLELFREYKIVTVMKSQIFGTKSKEEFEKKILDYGISLKSVSNENLEGIFKELCSYDNEDKLILSLVEEENNLASYSQTLSDLLQSQVRKPITKMWLCKYAFYFFNTYECRGLLLDYAMKIYLKQNLPCAPLAFSDIVLLFPEIEKYILDSSRAKLEVDVVKRNLLSILKETERIPFINSKFKNLFYYPVYFQYFLLLCEKKKDDQEIFQRSLDQVIFTSKMCLYLEKPGSWLDFFPTPTHRSEFFIEISTRLYEYQKLRENISKFGDECLLKGLFRGTHFTNSDANSLNFLKPIITQFDQISR